MYVIKLFLQTEQLFFYKNKFGKQKHIYTFAPRFGLWI